MVATMLLLLAGGPDVAATLRESAAASTPRPITIASLPLRSIAATRAMRPCTAVSAEPPRPWTPEKDVIGVAPADCWGAPVTVVAAGRRARLPAARRPVGDENERMRLAGVALPYLRGVVGSGAMMVALTGRLMLARGATPDVRVDFARGRAGATSYTTAPGPEGLTLGRPDRF